MTVKKKNKETILEKLDKLIDYKKDEASALKKIYESFNNTISNQIDKSTKKTGK